MENENESAKVPNAPSPIPGNLSYIIAKKVSSLSRSRSAYLDTAFADFTWCIKARSRDITRPNITGILIEPAKICATDGHRLHLITNPYPSIPPGEYEVYGINQSKVILISKSDKLFPDWNRPSITMEGNIPEHEIAISNPTDFYTDILKHQLFEIKYLQDAISNEKMTVRIYSEKKPIIITTATRTAIVMPIYEGKS